MPSICCMNDFEFSNFQRLNVVSFKFTLLSKSFSVCPLRFSKDIIRNRIGSSVIVLIGFRIIFVLTLSSYRPQPCALPPAPCAVPASFQFVLSALMINTVYHTVFRIDHIRFLSSAACSLTSHSSWYLLFRLQPPYPSFAHRRMLRFRIITAIAMSIGLMSRCG